MKHDKAASGSATGCWWRAAAKALGTPRMTAKLAARYDRCIIARCGNGTAPAPVAARRPC